MFFGHIYWSMTKLELKKLIKETINEIDGERLTKNRHVNDCIEDLVSEAIENGISMEECISALEEEFNYVHEFKKYEQIHKNNPNYFNKGEFKYTDKDHPERSEYYK